MRHRAGTFVWLMLYIILMSVVAISMENARSWAVSTFESPKAQSDWNTWRRRAREESGQKGTVTGPVIRREPQSQSPPALMLMNDHFAECLVFSLVLSTALFFTLMIALRGTCGSGHQPIERE